MKTSKEYRVVVGYGYIRSQSIDKGAAIAALFIFAA
jgi:hypothetical protein